MESRLRPEIAKEVKREYRDAGAEPPAFCNGLWQMGIDERPLEDRDTSGGYESAPAERRHMISLFVLGVSFIVLRGLGALGVRRLSAWKDAGRLALAIMFLFTGLSHFSSMKHDFAAMIPAPLPNGLWVIYLAGLFEVAGAVGLLIPRTRRLAGVCLVLLLVAMFPANVNAVLNGIPLGGNAPTPLWVRAPMQLLYVGMVWWTSIGKDPEEEVGRAQLKERLAEQERPPRQEGATS
jgi:uncharacterized membrane protein